MNWVRRRRPGPVVVLAVLLAVVAGLVGYVVGRASVPPGLASPVESQTFPVELAAFDDPRPIALRPVSASLPDLTVQVSGLVTRSGCVRGDLVRGGDAIWAVDGVARMAMHIAEPPYRDLRSGDTGRDVGLLRRALGVDSPTGVPAVVDAEVFAAYNALRAAAGLPATTVVSMADMVWLPRATVRVGRCLVAPGDRVAPGSLLASVAPSLVSWVVVEWPQGLVAGVRRIVVGGERVRLERGERRVTDPDGLSALQRAARKVRGRRSDDLPATLALARPIQAATLPASAVLGGERQCVVGEDGAVIPVRTVDSSLGRSVVVFSASVVPRAVVVDPARSTC